MFDLSEAEIDAMVGNPASPPGDADDIFGGLLGEPYDAESAGAPIPRSHCTDSLPELVGESRPEAPGTEGGADDPHVPMPIEEPRVNRRLKEPTGYAWEAACGRLPEFERLLRHYPPITGTQHPDFGRVVVAAFLSDRRRHVHRNLMFDGKRFFEAAHIKSMLDLEEPDFRIAIRMFPYKIGALVRYWEAHPGGDALGKSVTLVLEEGGIRRQRVRP